MSPSATCLHCLFLTLTLDDRLTADTEVSQIEHLLQTAEAIRKDGKPDWMQVTGLVHDLGKLLYFFGAEGQWDTVGDTFVVGAKFDERCIYPETCELATWKKPRGEFTPES